MAYTEDTRPEDLDALTAPAATDIVAIVDDPTGTPLTKKITLANLLKVVSSLTELAAAPDATADDILIIDGATTAKYINATNLLAVVGNLAELAEAPAASDTVLVIDRGVPKKVQYSDLVGGGGRARLSLPVTAAHLSDDTAGSAAAQIQKKTSSDATDPQLFWVEALFDAATDEHIYYQFLMPDNYASDPVVDVYYKAASSTADTVAFGAQMAAVTSADETDLDANLLDSANGGTSTSPATAGWMDVVSITMTNADSVAANDFVILCVYRDTSEDGAAGDLEVPLVVLRYTST